MTLSTSPNILRSANIAEGSLAVVVDEMTAKLKAGETLDLEHYVQAYPRHAEELKQLYPTLRLLADFSSSDPASICPPLPGEEEFASIGELGDFRLIREIGRGGMGVVYEAEQISLKRRVALKVLPFASTLDARQIQRFKNEAQAAACLHHTNIVPVHAVGTERGVHYYAMQCIDGQPLSAIIVALSQAKDLARKGPIHELANDNQPTDSLEPHGGDYAHGPAATEPKLQAAVPTKLSVTGRAFYRAVAELGEQAALALDHAHQRGIVHRDVKPGNLLLDGDGMVWITDFGLAQVQSDTRLTLTGDLLGTLRYMSPEQALAKRVIVDHRTDIYSLGATLYELLTLEPALLGNDREEILRQIAFEEPKPPRRINSAIPPELETIVQKALEKNPIDRYTTAKEMADDLRRFVENKLIQARRPTLRQRAKKWGHRHQGVVLTGLGALTALSVALAASTAWVWREMSAKEKALRLAEDSRQLAENSRAYAMHALRATTDDVMEHLLVANKAVGPAEQTFLSRALMRWQLFAATTSGTGELSRAIRAEAAFRMAKLRFKLGLRGENLTGLYQEAIHLYAGLAADFHNVPEYRQNLAESHHNLGAELWQLGMTDEAEAASRQALAIQKQLAADFPDEPQYRRNLAQGHNDLGARLRADGKLAESDVAYRQALAIEEKLADDFPLPEYRIELAANHHKLGDLLAGVGKQAAAETAHRQALAILEKLADDFPAVPEYRHLLARNHHDLGDPLEDPGKRAEAEVGDRKALAIHEKLVADFPAVSEYCLLLAASHHNLGDLLADLGKRRDAGADYRRALAIHEELALQEKLAADFPRVPAFRQNLAATQRNLGNLLADLGKQAEAEAAYHHVLAIQEKLATDFPAVHEYRRDLAQSHAGLGLLFKRLGKRVEAEAAFRRGLAIREKLAGEFPKIPAYRQDLAATQRDLGELLAGLGEQAGAEESFRQALATHEKLSADFPGTSLFPQELAKDNWNLGILLAGTGKQAGAEAAFRRALAIKENLAVDFAGRPEFPQELAKDNWNLCLLLARVGKQADAEAAFNQVLVITEKLVSDHPTRVEFRIELGSYQSNFGELLREGQRPEQALKWFARAIETLEPVLRQVKVNVPAQQFLRNAHLGRAQALDNLKRHGEAVNDWDKAVELSPEPQRSRLRMNRAASRVRAGQVDVDATIIEVEELLQNADGTTLYNAACSFALASASPHTSSLVTKQKYAQRAVALLQQAVAKGWKDAGHMKKDTDLDSLHGREDFKELIAQLELNDRRP